MIRIHSPRSDLRMSSAIALGNFKNIGITKKDLQRVEEEGYVTYFLESVKAIDALNTYQEYIKTGWSSYLGNITRRKLAPIIMKNVCLAWYAATKDITE